MTEGAESLPASPRGVKGCCYAIFGIGASLFAVVLRALAFITRPVCRFGRLARLRALTSGHIPTTTQFDGPVYALPGSRVFLGEYCRLCCGVYFETNSDARISIGRHSFINSGSMIVAGAGIDIGDYAMIGEYVSIRDTNHGIAAGALVKLQPQSAAPVTIGADVWIGRGAVILSGVTLGDGAIIGANSVVTRDIPPGAIAVGAPAKIIRHREPRKCGTGTFEKCALQSQDSRTDA